MSARTVSALVVCASVVALGHAHGGYAPTTWGWAALAAFWTTILALVFGSNLFVDRGGLALLGAVTALTGLTALSATWSGSVPRTMFEVERDLVYVGAVAAVVVFSRIAGSRALLVGLVTGLAAIPVYALGWYIVAPGSSDVTQGYLLFRPIGYANALGGVAVLAFLPVLALATYDQRSAVRAAAGGVTVVLSVALFLTQNRSAWIAVSGALALWVMRTRLPHVALAGAVILGLPAGAAIASIGSLNLLDARSPASEIRSQRLVAGAVVVVLALAGSALAALVRPLRIPQRLAVSLARVAGALASAGLAIAVFHLGDRAHYWRVAWRTFRHHPLVGAGAGTFDIQWFRYRDVALTVHDAHNLYLGTLAELGVIGLAVLVAVLAIPIVSSRRTRDPLLTAALASYCGFLVHLAFEWDWKFPVVAGSGLALAAILAGSAPGSAPIRIAGGARLAVLGLALIGAAFVVVTLAGNSYVVAAESRITAGDDAGAAARANRARRFLPWSSEPWLVLTDSDLRERDVVAARAAARKALLRDPNDWMLWVRLSAVTRGEPRAAAARRALALNPLLLTR